MPKHLTPTLVNYASILEDNTRNQAVTTSAMPFIFPHMALMPDAHLGKGATVGSVIPTLGAIMPAAVGVDIGCGMMAVRTRFTKDQIAGLDRSVLRKSIEASIPLSPGKYNGSLTSSASRRTFELELHAEHAEFNPYFYAENWPEQIGSLGGGNHFIEVSLDQHDFVWLFLHSGSRGVGNKIAQRHIKIAQDLMARYYIDLPDRDLAYLVEETDEFVEYVSQLRWAQAFAAVNRAEMMDRLADCFREWVGHDDLGLSHDVNCHHNYTEQERHFGKDVWLSRKGAISARAGEWGLIPGSMGTRSYVVQGKGNKVALHSAPHGAGREYSRSAARKAFTLDDLVAAMGDIEFRADEAFVDEIPAAYKDIDTVMADAADLVEVRYELRQIVNVKGQ